MGLQELMRDLGFAAGLLLARPFSCLLQVTNRCNMRCSFCDFWPNGAPPQQELTLDDFARLERELFGVGRFLVSIEGGEPFVRPDLLEIVRLFSRRHIPVLYTNGWYVDEASARALFEAGLVQVGVSIDYADSARHDAKRGLPGAFEKAWNAVRLLRDAAPHGGRQVHVMTVLMEDNTPGLEPLLQMSASHGVGHCATLLATGGYRRGGTSAADRLPGAGTSAVLLALWRRYPHFRVWRDYLEHVDAFLSRETSHESLPTCRAGRQSFNVDHLGNVSPCIEKIDRPAGNIRTDSLQDMLARMAGLDWVARCQDCWTACRGLSQFMGGRGSPRAWLDFAARMRSS